MPIMRCTEKGKPGWKWGKSGKCYIYLKGNKASSKRAKAKAIKQAVAIQYERKRAGKKTERI